MKKNLFSKKYFCNSLCIFATIIVFTSCKNSEFEVVSNKNTLIKYKEISLLENFIPAVGSKLSKEYNVNGDYYVDYPYSYSGYTTEIKKKFVKDNIKGILSKITIFNNSNQIIEKSNLTVRIQYIFENDKEFNYFKPYDLLPNNKIWKKSETLDYNLNDVIEFCISDDTKILKIHTPKKVIIEYYITAKNSIDYNSLGEVKETFKTGSYHKDTKNFGLFTSTPIEKNMILGLGDKIFSKDITELWNENLSEEDINEVPVNGDLDNTFSSQELLKKEIQEKNKLTADGWKEEEIQNGQLSSCYNFNPTKGIIKNRLEVIVGGGTDVSIKVMSIDEDKCIRYVFINSGTTFTIENIPEGEYYLKIAYGKKWYSKNENGQCIGKFIKNAMYEKGEDILDFNTQRNSQGRNIPIYKLSLDVVSNGVANSFNSQNISEIDFNK